jgi:DnaJ-class molecular chaperone
MKITKQNTVRADGYNTDKVRQCPKCHGDGLYMGNPDGGVAFEMTCEICEGFGLVMLDESDENSDHN